MLSDEISFGPNIGRARNVARLLLRDAEIKEVPVSLPSIIACLKSQRDLEVLRLDLEDLGGLTVTVDGQPTIGFNKNHPWVKRRFSIGHEIGHLLLGHVCSENPSDGTHGETEANQFAAELLVPLVFIKKDFAQCRDLDLLAKKYVVSKEMLCWHLIECRVI